MYTHKHHIIPKHMGGIDDPSNLVEVSVEKHTELHKQLWEDLGHTEDYIAWRCLSGAIGSEEAKILAIKEARKRDIGKKKKPHSELTKKKMSEAAKGRKASPETRKKQSDYAKTQKHTEKRKQNHSIKMKEYWKKRKLLQGIDTLDTITFQLDYEVNK